MHVITLQRKAWHRIAVHSTALRGMAWHGMVLRSLALQITALQSKAWNRIIAARDIALDHIPWLHE
eukprot:9086792-Pyramimonas_sp.AAC.1